MSEELIPENPEQETEENEAAEAIKQRKNGLYPAVSDELAENMKSGWADTELQGLQPIPRPSTPRTGAPRSPPASPASAWSSPRAT